MPAVAAHSRGQRYVLVMALPVTVVVAWLAAREGTAHVTLLLVATAIGVTLYQARFGFTSAYRALMTERDARGVRAQLVMLAVATALFAPVLATGTALGHGVTGAWAPAGVSVAAGAFLFGLGMQLAGGCGSGTLYTMGGGSVRMLVTLIAFCAGGFWASLHLGWWQALPALSPAPLGSRIGWAEAAGLQLALLGIAWWALGRLRPTFVAARGAWALLRGPWPLIAGALLLAALNFATLLTAGHPWSITWGFTLWGAKAAAWLGWDPVTSEFWSSPFAVEALREPLTADITSLMNIGIVLGALGASALAGRFAPTFRLPPRAMAATLFGGVAMGYGARIAFGCNIGAFFSGVASTSLHGWLWIVAALPGMWLGVRLRDTLGAQRVVG